MATINSLLVRLGADNADFQRTMNDSLGYVNDFADRISKLNRIMEKPARVQVEYDSLNKATAQAEELMATMNKMKFTPRGTAIDPNTGLFMSNAELQRLQEARDVAISTARTLQASVTERTAQVKEFDAALQQTLGLLQSDLQATVSGMSDKLARGMIDPAKFRQLSGEAAFAFNQGIIGIMDELGAKGMLSPKLQSELQSMLRADGIKAGAALSQGIAQGASNLPQQLGRTFTNAEGQLTTFGRRFGTMAVGLGFGIESFANGTDAGMRRALRSVETFAFMGFGQGGLIVAGLITAGLALFDFWHRQEKRAEEAAKKIQGALVTAFNVSDNAELIKKQRDIYMGAPAVLDGDKFVKVAASQYAKNAFQGSLEDLLGEKGYIEDYIANHTDLLAANLRTRLTKVNALIAPLQEQANLIADLINNPAQMSRVPGPLQAVTVSANSAKRDFAAEAAAAQAALSGTIMQMETLHLEGKNVSVEIASLLHMLGGLGDETRRATEPWKDYEKRVADIHRIVEALAKLVPKIEIPKIAGPDFGDAMKNWKPDTSTGPIGAFQEQIAQIERIKTSFAFGTSSKETQDKLLDPFKDKALDAARALRSQLEGLRATLGDQAIDKLIDQIAEALHRAGIEAKQTKSEFQKMGEALQQSVDTLSALADLAGAAGNDKLATTLSNAANAAQNVGTAVMAGGTDPVADIKAAASVVTLVKGLMDDPVKRENNVLVGENNKRLSEVALRLQGFAVTATANSNLGTALQAFFKNQGAVNELNKAATHKGGILGSSIEGDLQTQVNALNPFLDSVGLTFDQFKKIVEASGIQVFDKYGRIVTDALQQLASGINDVTKSLFTLQNTYADQKSLRDVQDKLSGASVNPFNALKSGVDLLQKLAPNLLQGSFDAATVAGREALRKALQSLVAAVAAGTIAAKDFGALQNLSELMGIVSGLADDLDKLRTATNAATDSLSNVPTWWKVNLARFDAALPLSAPEAPKPVDTNPWQQVTIEHLEVVSPDSALAGKKVLESLQDLAVQRIGDRTRWPEMN